MAMAPVTLMVPMQARGRREDDHQDDGEQVDREGEDQVHHPHDHACRPGRRSSRRSSRTARPTKSASSTDDTPDQQRDAGAVDDAAQHVAAELVGAERMVPARALEGAGSGRVAIGLWGASTSAKIATTSSTATMPAPTSAVVLLRSRRSPWTNGDSERLGAPPATATPATGGSSASPTLPPLMGRGRRAHRRRHAPQAYRIRGSRNV